MSVQIDGLGELVAAINAAGKCLYEDETVKAFLKAARTVQRAAQRSAPKGDHPAYSDTSTGYSKAPGRLRRAIVAKAFRAYAIKRFGPAAFAQVNTKRGKTTAPYANPLTAGRRDQSAPSKARAFRWLNSSRDWQFARRLKGFPPNRFWERAVDSVGPGELAELVSFMGTLIGKRYTR